MRWSVTKTTGRPLRVRSLVGLIPMFAVEVIDATLLKKMPLFVKRLDWYLRYRPKLAALVSRWNSPGADDSRLLAIVRAFRSSKLLQPSIRRCLSGTSPRARYAAITAGA